MRGVLLDVPESLLAERRTSGADRWDEMWDGVVHMNPPPTIDHQELEYELECWLRRHWKAASGGGVYHKVGVARPGRWPQDYRSPDLVLVGPERLDRLRETHLEGGPTVAIEIRSPGDESYDKLDFYAAVDTAEVWIVDRDTKRPDVYILRIDGYVGQPAGADGWVTSPATGVSLRTWSGNRIELRLGGDDRTAVRLPGR